MTNLDIATSLNGKLPNVVDLNTSISDKWVFFHELGHNMQRDSWTFQGTQEVTNELFSLHAVNKIYSVDPWSFLRSGGFFGNKLTKANAYIQSGIGDWTKDNFFIFVSYAQLIRAFGFDTFTKVFIEYEALGEVQWSDDRKRDEWMMRMSRAVNKSLGPFYKKWRIPVTDEAINKVSALMEWMPDWNELN